MNIFLLSLRASLLLTVMFILFAGKTEATELQAGERLVYDLRWEFISAGEASLEILPDTTIQGKAAKHFRLTAKSTPFIDWFYKVRDTIDSYVAADFKRTLHYTQKQHEGSFKRDIQLLFNWAERKVQFINFGKKAKPVELMETAFDPLGIMYAFRAIKKVEVGKVYELPVTDGRKMVMGRVHIIKKETIRVGGRAYPCILVVPELKHIGGVFRKSKNAKMEIWFSDDERRIPVRLKSKVVVGSFMGDLIRLQSGQK